MVNIAVAHLEARGSGHLVGISSIAALRGNRVAPAYNASKAFVSNYLEGVRNRFAKLKLRVAVTDVQPGYVDTPMAKGNLFWVASPEKAARQILAATRARRHHVYSFFISLRRPRRYTPA
jgi:short-subunit dehydrogenase